MTTRIKRWSHAEARRRGGETRNSASPRLRVKSTFARIYQRPFTPFKSRANVANDEAEAWHIGTVRSGSVDDIEVMQRALPRPQREIDGLAGINITDDSLAMAEEILAIGHVRMRQAKTVRAGDCAHASVRRAAVGQRDPGREKIVRADGAIGAVLMPRRVRIATRLLAENERSPDAHRAVREILDRIDDGGMPRQLPSPRRL